MYTTGPINYAPRNSYHIFFHPGFERVSSREGQIPGKQYYIFSYFEARYTTVVVGETPPFTVFPGGEMVALNLHDGGRKTPRIRMNWTSALDPLYSFYENKSVGREKRL